MSTLADALVGVERLGLDTAPIIYFVEAHPRYDALVTPLFASISDGAITGFTSVISLSEVLVQPFARSNLALAQAYRTILVESEHFMTLAVDTAIAERAAELRARYGLRTPDALQIAAALVAGCEAFLTNDTGLRRVGELPILVLEDFVDVS